MFRIKDPDRFQKLMSGFQSLVVAVGVLVAGAWALYAFNAQLSVENAKAQLAKLQREVEGRASLDVRVAASQFRIKGSDGRFIHGTVRVKNLGTRTTVLAVRPGALEIAPIAFDAKGALLVGTPIDPDIVTARGFKKAFIQAFPGRTTEDEFLVRVPTAGTYLVTFRAPMSSLEAVESLKAGIAPPTTPETELPWANHTIVAVD